MPTSDLDLESIQTELRLLRQMVSTLQNQVSTNENRLNTHRHTQSDLTASLSGENSWLTGFTENDDLSDTTYPVVETDGATATLLNGDAGEAVIRGGAGNGTGTGQNVYLYGGQGGATGTGGAAQLFGGKGGSTSGDGGTAIIWGGYPDYAHSATGAGGDVQIVAGSSNNNSAGANTEIFGGNGYINAVGTGNGGNIDIYPGDGVVDGAMRVFGHYGSDEHDIGSITGTATIDFALGNVQYATMTGNVTLTFSNALSGGRYLLHLAGAFTPTFPSNVRWTAGTTPTATATAGKKDIYTIIYSGKESLYDVLQSPNYSIT